MAKQESTQAAKPENESVTKSTVEAKEPEVPVTETKAFKKFSLALEEFQLEGYTLGIDQRIAVMPIKKPE
tara:strand:+ start:330 stop:539 length:210 start_codon:yes stop_codon:yes gene_type:complete